LSRLLSLLIVAAMAFSAMPAYAGAQAPPEQAPAAGPAQSGLAAPVPLVPLAALAPLAASAAEAAAAAAEPAADAAAPGGAGESGAEGANGGAAASAPGDQPLSAAPGDLEPGGQQNGVPDAQPDGAAAEGGSPEATLPDGAVPDSDKPISEAPGDSVPGGGQQGGTPGSAAEGGQPDGETPPDGLPGDGGFPSDGLPGDGLPGDELLEDELLEDELLDDELLDEELLEEELLEEELPDENGFFLEDESEQIDGGLEALLAELGEFGELAKLTGEGEMGEMGMMSAFSAFAYEPQADPLPRAFDQPNALFSAPPSGYSPQDYPQSPDDGYVRLAKSADWTDFAAGKAKISLSAWGAPVRQSTDTIILFDNTPSMGYSIYGTRYRYDPYTGVQLAGGTATSSNGKSWVYYDTWYNGAIGRYVRSAWLGATENYVSQTYYGSGSPPSSTSKGWRPFLNPTNTRLSAARPAIMRLVDALLPPNEDTGNRVALVPFVSTSAWVQSGFGAVDELGSPAGKFKDELMNVELPSSGSTRFTQAFQVAYAQLINTRVGEDRNRPVNIILITDGDCLDASSAYDAANWLKAEGYSIYTIGIDNSSSGRKKLNAIASPGKAWADALSYDLTGVFNQVANSILAAGSGAVVTDTVSGNFTITGVAADRGTPTFNAGSGQVSWAIGDVSDVPATLEISVTLKGAIADGQFPTNVADSAKIAYTNFRKAACTQTVAGSPILARPDKVVRIEYYLADDSGKTVNGNGDEVLSFADREVVRRQYWTAGDAPLGDALVILADADVIDKRYSDKVPRAFVYDGYCYEYVPESAGANGGTDIGAAVADEAHFVTASFGYRRSTRAVFVAGPHGSLKVGGDTYLAGELYVAPATVGEPFPARPTPEPDPGYVFLEWQDEGGEPVEDIDWPATLGEHESALYTAVFKLFGEDVGGGAFRLVAGENGMISYDSPNYTFADDGGWIELIPGGGRFGYVPNPEDFSMAVPDDTIVTEFSGTPSGININIPDGGDATISLPGAAEDLAVGVIELTGDSAIDPDATIDTTGKITLGVAADLTLGPDAGAAGVSAIGLPAGTVLAYDAAGNLAITLGSGTDGEITLPSGKEIVLPAGSEIILRPDGTIELADDASGTFEITLPGEDGMAGNPYEKDDIVIALPEGSTIAPNGTITAGAEFDITLPGANGDTNPGDNDNITVTVNAKATIDIAGTGATLPENTVTITPANESGVEGSIALPDGTVIVVSNYNNPDFDDEPNQIIINPDGSVDLPNGGSLTLGSSSPTLAVTIDGAVNVDADGITTMPEGGELILANGAIIEIPEDTELEFDYATGTITIEFDEATKIVLQGPPDSEIEIPDGTTVIVKADGTITLSDATDPTNAGVVRLPGENNEPGGGDDILISLPEGTVISGIPGDWVYTVP
ncbi:MAG: VWA domain-containing protein, partial [Clostridiales bacterium]|nr:VWA domain-containing protein [Clostridiales bacterium]